ncbi:LysR substrate-binding domain-containing protein [Gallaecimonas kandeliae]|uniref:LysR substrate-binding domain-containing protein n=1 Tax=Gallaecimonas kandeliae TaxID=3029055 RepID=UPI002647DA84|nr:LysR substrate-binding domain-containing protein [Gallaecimonas kandeliae]WKE66333.1 LysR substrate-binding domain-containing protein [Gallaecimonas kandeliae]
MTNGKKSLIDEKSSSMSDRYMFSRLPQLSQIRGFEAAARLGSFKAAGEELNISPTAISHQISNLEDKLGVLLFERKTRSVSLTQEGHRLAQAAHQALKQLTTAVEEMSDTQSVLRVSTTASFAAMWLIPSLSRFQNKHPEIKTEIITSEEVIDINRDRRVDLAIRYGCHDENNKNKTVLINESFSAYATEDYLDRLKDLKDAVFIETKWKNKNLPSVALSHYLQKINKDISAPRICSFDQEHHVIQAALAGQGIAFVSSVLADMALQKGWLKPLDESFSLPGLTYSLLVSPFSEGLRKVAVFKEWIAEELSKYPSKHIENRMRST